MTDRKFYKTVVQTTVLSEEPLEETNLDYIHYRVTYDDCSGITERVSAEELTGEQVAKELIAQGSCPSFFNLTKSGDENCYE